MSSSGGGSAAKWLVVTIVAAVCAVALILGVVVSRGDGESSGATTAESGEVLASQPSESPTATDAPSGSTTAKAEGKRARGGRSEPIPTAESFEDLPVDEDIVSRELVEGTVCGLDSSSVRVLVGSEDGGETDLDLLRDAVITLSDQIELWKQSDDLDPRIAAAIRHAERINVHWRKALGYNDAGEKAKVKVQLARAEAQMTAMDKAAATQLCPSNE